MQDGLSPVRSRGRFDRPDEPPRLDLALALHLDETERLGEEVVAQALPGRARDLDLVRHAVRLHATRHVDGVAPQVVEEASPPDHAGDHGTGADADPKSEVASVGEARLRALEHVEPEL